MSAQIYNKKPLSHFEDIPVFSVINKYIENYEKISGDHMDFFNKTGKNPFMEESQWKLVEDSTKELIKKYSKPGNKILDVGVGLGRLLEDFTDLDRYGMDISTNYLKQTKEKGINCCVSLIEDMPYEDNLFDIITSTDVLEHVLDLNLAIKNILRVLKPGGVLIVRVPYKEDISWYLSKDCPYEFVHVRSFDENQLLAMFTKIFDTEFLEWNTSGVNLELERLKYPVPPYNYILTNMTRMYYKLKSKNPKQYETFFNKNEINFVIRKK